MLLNYLKLAIRLLIRNPFFTFINVLSLSIGFAVFFILWQYTQSELKSDRLQCFGRRPEAILWMRLNMNNQIPGINAEK